MDIFYRRGSAWTGTGLDRIVPAGHQSTGPNKTWRKIIFTLWMIKFGFWISETYSISVFRLKICLTRSLLNLNGNETFLKWTLTGTKIGQFDWLTRIETMGIHLGETDYWNWLVWNNEFNFWLTRIRFTFNSPRQNKDFSASIQILVTKDCYQRFNLSTTQIAF